MAQNIILKRSAIPGKIPTTGSLQVGELALNTYDGKAFIRQSGSLDKIITLVAADSNGVLNVTESLTLTGSLLGTASFATSASWAPSTSPFPFTGSAGITGSLDVAGLINATGISAPARYDIAVFNGFNDIVVLSGFAGVNSAITNNGNYNPNYNNISNLASYISYLYVEVMNLDTAETVKDLRFATENDLRDYVSNSGITNVRITLYAYQNDTSTLRIGGSNQFSTLCTVSGRTGKIASKRSLQRRIESTGIGMQALQGYLTSSFVDDLGARLSNVSELITKNQVNTLIGDGVSNGYPGVYFMQFDKYEVRKKSGLYIKMSGNVSVPVYVVDSSLTITNPSNKTKIIATALMRVNDTLLPTPGDITMIHASKTHNDSNTTNHRLFPTANYGWFNIYILQDLDTDSRGLAVEFLSIDSINIPFNNKWQTPPSNSEYFFKKGNILRRLPNTNINGTRIDSQTFTEFRQLSELYYKNEVKRPIKDIDIIRLYDNGTCDVFDKSLKIAYTTYNARNDGQKLVFWFYKLNKRGV